MTFFSNVQALARRPRNLPLRSITVVFSDPILQETPSFSLNMGVARMFNEIKIHDEIDEESKKLWTSRIDYCRWILTQPHEARADTYSVAERSKPTSTWGDPSLEIRMRTADRRYGSNGDEFLVC
jgi:hypothetical protein